jgi:hypothetical protein
MVLRSICKWSLCSEVHWSIVCRTGSLKFLLSQRFLRVNWGVIFPDARALTWCSIASSLCSDFLKVSPIASAPCGFRCPLAALGVGFGRRSRCKWSPLAKARFSDAMPIYRAIRHVPGGRWSPHSLLARCLAVRPAALLPVPGPLLARPETWSFGSGCCQARRAPAWSWDWPMPVRAS